MAKKTPEKTDDLLMLAESALTKLMLAYESGALNAENADEREILVGKKQALIDAIISICNLKLKRMEMDNKHAPEKKSNRAPLGKREKDILKNYEKRIIEKHTHAAGRKEPSGVDTQ